jgi:hypothetical protein
MGRTVIFWLAMVCCGSVQAQIPIVDIIGEVAKKAVMAIDLGVQRLQTETIGLQETQKALENSMELDELGGIAAWLQEQKDLYAGYYNELWQVKNVLVAYERVAEMLGKEGQIAVQFRQMSAAISADKHFSAAEVTMLTSTLNGIVEESVRNVSQLELAIKALVTQMSDGDRLRIIDGTGNSIDRNYSDLQSFYQRSVLVSVERAQDENDLAATKALYGLQ